MDVSDANSFITEVELGSEMVYTVTASSSIELTTEITAPVGVKGGTVSRVTLIASPTNSNQFCFDVFFIIVDEIQITSVSQHFLVIHLAVASAHKRKFIPAYQSFYRECTGRGIHPKCGC